MLTNVTKMKFAHLITCTALTLTLTITESEAQYRPAPTGQVPRNSSGQIVRPYAGYQPRPTGQIAPAVAGQPVGTLPQAAPAVPAQNPSTVQNLGFESSTPAVSQEGQVPKVNTNQDPRTFPERYQSTSPVPATQTITIQESQLMPQRTPQEMLPAQTPATTGTSPATQTNGNVQTYQQGTNTNVQQTRPQAAPQTQPATNAAPASSSPVE